MDVLCLKLEDDTAALKFKTHAFKSQKYDQNHQPSTINYQQLTNYLENDLTSI